MKKRFMFLSISIVVLIFATIFNFEILSNRLNAYANLKDLYSSIDAINLPEIQSTLHEECIVPIIKSSILGSLTLILAVLNIIILILSAMRVACGEKENL